MISRHRALTLSALVAITAGCGGTTPPPVPNGAALVQPYAAGSEHGPFLYVGNMTLSQYGLEGGKPLRSVKSPSGESFGGMTLDHAGRLIAIDGVGAIQVYDARKLALLGKINAGYPQSVAVDRGNDVYVANCGAGVEIFSPGGAKRIGAIGAQYGSCVVAAAPSGDIYVVDGYHAIHVYAPQQKAGRVKLVRTIQAGLDGPDALAFGPRGEVYVSNYPPSGRHGGSVVVYAPNGTSPKLTITASLNLPSALVVDSQGTLYVANDPQTWKHRDGSVTIYAAGSTKPLRRIGRYVNAPLALAVDASDDLYVGSGYSGRVAVYSAQGAKLLRTIKGGVADPNTVTIGL